MGRLKSLLLGSLAFATLGLVAPSPAVSNDTRVTTSTSQSGNTQAQTITITTRETEQQRYRRLKGKRGYRLLYPTKHRSAGDRAHKRFKKARRAA